MQVKETGKALTTLEQFLGMQGGKKTTQKQTLISPMQQNRYPLCDPRPFEVTGKTSWLGNLTVYVAIPVPWGLSKAWFYCQRGSDTLSQHLTGTLKEQLFLLEVEIAAVNCSQDRCRQQRFGTEEMSPCSKAHQSPPLPYIRKGIRVPVWFMVFNSLLQEKSTFVSMTQTPTEDCVAIPQKAV